MLPPIARLTHAQAAYHFISGYTAKLAGTEVGVKEPKATFSACFGAPFMPRHPGEYARMLTERLARAGRPGLAGQHRLDGRPVRHRRADEHRPHPVDGPGGARRRGWPAVPTRIDPIFGVEVPLDLPGRAGAVPRPARDVGRHGRLRPAGRQLAAMFAANFGASPRRGAGDRIRGPERRAGDATAGRGEEPGAG